MTFTPSGGLVIAGALKFLQARIIYPVKTRDEGMMAPANEL